MKDPAHDSLLWELPRDGTGDDGPPPPDAELTAYREGTLAPPEATRVEWGLAGSRQGRARLAELAGIRPDLPARRRVSKFTAAALAVAAAIALAALLVLDRGDRPLPQFDVRAEGLATRRDTPGEARAHAGGTVRIVVEPRGAAVSGLSFAAYRLDAEGLSRLVEPSELQVEAERGSAVLAAKAELLIGAGTGTRPFFVVVADGGRLPSHLSAGAEDPVELLRRISKGRVYRVPLTIAEEEP